MSYRATSPARTRSRSAAARHSAPPDAEEVRTRSPSLDEGRDPPVDPETTPLPVFTEEHRTIIRMVQRYRAESNNQFRALSDAMAEDRERADRTDRRLEQVLFSLETLTSRLEEPARRPEPREDDGIMTPPIRAQDAGFTPHPSARRDDAARGTLPSLCHAARARTTARTTGPMA